MDTSGREKFSYALVSAAPLQDSDATGIGVIFKARDRSTIKTLCYALTNADEIAATYEAVTCVLEEALATGVGRPAIYLDNREVVSQLVGHAEVPRRLLAVNLRARAMMNQVGRPQIIPATTSARFSARRLAASAMIRRRRLPGLDTEQLTLLTDIPA